MARKQDEGAHAMTSNDNMDAARKTYVGVMSFLKWGTIGAAVVTAIVVLLIAS